MPIVIVDNFDVNVGKNIDSRYGPYATTGQAIAAISSIFRYKGLTVLITGSGQNIEYWFNPTTADGDLVPKGASFDTSSLVTTSSFNSWTGSSTSQFAGTASYASNGGVTQLLQGTNIVLSPNPGVGSVTVSAIAGGGGSGLGQNATSSFANSTTWTFTHGLGTRYPVIQALDANHNQIIPEKIELVDNNTAQITFPTQETGYAIATVGGATASYLRVLNQDLIISGNIIPAGPYTNNTSSYDLGSSTAAWRDLYVSNGSIKMISGSNSASIQYNSGAVTITGASLTITSGSVTSPNRPAFSVYGSGTTNNLTTTQNGDGTLNSNNFAVTYAQGTGFNSSTGIFTAPIAGLYQVTLVGRNSGFAGSISQLCVLKNNSTTGGDIMMIEWAASSTMNHAGGAQIFKLAVGDTLRLRVLAGQINFDPNDNWSVAYIG